jgi:hypothetical protein
VEIVCEALEAGDFVVIVRQHRCVHDDGREHETFDVYASRERVGVIEAALREALAMVEEAATMEGRHYERTR